MDDTSHIKIYFDYKSPYAYLAFQPTLDLVGSFDVQLHWIPYLLRIKGKGQRSVYSEWKVRYSYSDARRFANRQGGFPIRGPRKVYDSSPALIGSLYAMREDCFVDYSRAVFSRFFDHRLEIDQFEEIAEVLEEQGLDSKSFHQFAREKGVRLLDQAIARGEADHVFGVPMFIFRSEQFWGADRLWLLRERLRECGLHK